MKILTFFIFFSLVPALGSEEFYLKISSQPHWTLNDLQRDKFRLFLRDETQWLNKHVKDLRLPNKISTPQEFLSFTGLRPGNVKVRNISCRFLNRVRQGLKGEVLSRFNNLTSAGRICLVSDVSPNKQKKWAQDLATFFFEENWAPFDNKLVSIKELVGMRLNQPVVNTDIRVITSKEYEGYGWAWSSMDRDRLLRHNSFFKRLVDSLRGAYDPDEPKFDVSFGTVLPAVVNEDSAGMASLFIQNPTILLAKSFTPFEVIDFLAHEYGHVLHGINKRTFEGGATEIVIHSDHHHNEAVAEAVAWNSLSPLYDRFPEIKIVHILKLNYFLHQKPNDPHVEGAGALFDFLHVPPSEFRPSLMSNLLKSPDLSSFLKKESIRTLTSRGQLKEKRIRLK